MDFSSSGTRVRLEGYSLRALIMEAYNFRNFQVSVPGIDEDEQQNTFYDIVAIAPEGTAPTRDEFRRMLQTLLADRFQRKRVVLAVCTGWMSFEMMSSCRKQRVLVGCR
jgi:uncharacterized protein (TIGR03435 family)